MTFMPTEKNKRPGIGFGSGITTMEQLRVAEHERSSDDWRTPGIVPEFDAPDENGFYTAKNGLKFNPHKIYARLEEEKQTMQRKEITMTEKPEQHMPPIPARKPDFETIEKPQFSAKKPKYAENDRIDIEKKLLDFIATYESSDNYNVIVGGEEKPLTKMTIKQVRELQKERGKNKRGTAIGRYQIIDDKMNDLMLWMNIDENNLFDEKMQDEMGKELLRRRGSEKHKKGEITTDEFIKNLSKEWAALPKDESNHSYYKGVGNNKAHVDFKTLKALIEK